MPVKACAMRNGAGSDHVYDQYDGTFNGEAGHDSVGTLNGGTFNGGMWACVVAAAVFGFHGLMLCRRL